METPVTYKRQMSTGYCAAISSSDCASKSTYGTQHWFSGHCGARTKHGCSACHASVINVSAPGVKSSTKFKSSPRSPAPCKNSTSGYVLPGSAFGVYSAAFKYRPSFFSSFTEMFFFSIPLIIQNNLL